MAAEILSDEVISFKLFPCSTADFIPNSQMVEKLPNVSAI